MSTEIETKYTFIPWLRQGLSRYIEEVDTLANSNQGALAFKRAQLQVKTSFELLSLDKTSSIKNRAEIIDIDIVGPGDIIGIHQEVIRQVVPNIGVKNFEENYVPFIEFHDPDFPWRYTPAKEKKDKLRPWLSLIVCKKNEYEIQTEPDGLSILHLKIHSQEQYEEIFCDSTKVWKNAHVQISQEALELKKGETEKIQLEILQKEVNEKIEKDPESVFSRILSTRRLSEFTAYTAFLIPTFETGRLAGIKQKIDATPAQMPAWEKNYDTNKSKQGEPFHFPTYYYWDFETDGLGFAELVKKLNVTSTDSLPAGLKVDVQKMGVGLNYSNLNPAPKRKVIDIPVATVPIGYASEAFPSRLDEKELKNRLEELLSKNPVLLKGRAETQVNQNEGEMDDPWIVPPLFGAKHINATSLKEKDNEKHPWFPQLNMDIRYRAAAGLGRRIVQEHQELFVQRAWEQVEMINAINQVIRQFLLKHSTNKRLFITRYPKENAEDLMIYFEPLKFTPLLSNNTSINDYFLNNKISTAMVSSAFQQLANKQTLPGISAVAIASDLVNRRIQINPLTETPNLLSWNHVLENNKHILSNIDPNLILE